VLRRDFLKACAASTLVGCRDFSSDSSGSPGPRNIVLVTGDDLGWKDLSSLGNPNIRTPNLDRLARGGVSFRNAFDVTSTCSSSRATYATGQYPHTHGVVGLVHRLPELSLPEGTPTLASHLRSAGLVTAIEGKWHVAFPTLPDRYGYEEVLTSIAAQWIYDSDRTIDFLQRVGDRRFFLEINYMNPHRNYVERFEQHPEHPKDPAALVIPEWMHLPDVRGLREELAGYYSQIDRMDVLVGELVAALETRGLLDDTLLVFISDNGPPFAGNKLNLYDRGTGTPFFFHWPAGLPSGIERGDLVSSIDLMPTLLDVAGIAIPPNVQGRSLLPLLKDPTKKDDRGVVFGEMTKHQATPFPMRSVRTDRFRYIKNYSDEPVPIEGEDQPWVAEVLAMDLPGYRWRARRVPEELYDLATDPREQVNLVADERFAGELADLRARLDAHLEATSDAIRGSL
jgi:N-sulfoglucosamine sulfohydrolase